MEKSGRQKRQNRTGSVLKMKFSRNRIQNEKQNLYQQNQYQNRININMNTKSKGE